MVWGCMSWRGLGHLAIINGIMESDKYIQVIQIHLMPQAAEWYPSGDWIFQQDGAHCHTSKKTLQFFDDCEIPLFPWTANSPDLNPMENIWSLLKQRVYRLGASSKDELIRNIKEVAGDTEYWERVCQDLYSSLENRIERVVRNRGGHCF